MSIKDALLYISPSAGHRNERTAVFAGTLATQFGAEVSGLTFAFDLPYRDAIFTAVAGDPAIRDLGRKSREQAAAALTDAESAFKKLGVRFTGTLESSRASDSIDLFVQYERLRDIGGGAIAHGHPIGATGAVPTTRLLHSMQRDGINKGVVALCIGGGQGIALALEAIT